MNEWCHDPTGARPGYAPRHWHLGQISDAIADARVELGLGRGQSIPVRRVGNVLEEINRRIDRADNAYGARPDHPADRYIHQAPRSASRYFRRSIRSVISPRNIKSRPLRPSKASLGLRIHAYPRAGSVNR